MLRASTRAASSRSSVEIICRMGRPTYSACGRSVSGKLVATKPGEPGPDLVRDARQGVALVHHQREPASTGREVDRHRHVAAEAHHHVGADPVDDLERGLDRAPAAGRAPGGDRPRAGAAAAPGGSARAGSRRPGRPGPRARERSRPRSPASRRPAAPRRQRSPAAERCAPRCHPPPSGPSSSAHLLRLEAPAVTPAGDRRRRRALERRLRTWLVPGQRDQQPQGDQRRQQCAAAVGDQRQRDADDRAAGPAPCRR